VPAYLELLARPDRCEVIERLRAVAFAGPVAVWDPDSYDLRSLGISDVAAAIEVVDKPFAHAFVVAMIVMGIEDVLFRNALQIGQVKP
jgi:hypothetical protein